ncbi:MAG: hypothetical protein RR588_09625, partial [Solibacillus sp.]
KNELYNYVRETFVGHTTDWRNGKPSVYINGKWVAITSYASADRTFSCLQDKAANSYASMTGTYRKEEYVKNIAPTNVGNLTISGKVSGGYAFPIGNEKGGYVNTNVTIKEDRWGKQSSSSTVTIGGMQYSSDGKTGIKVGDVSINGKISGGGLNLVVDYSKNGGYMSTDLSIKVNLKKIQGNLDNVNSTLNAMGDSLRDALIIEDWELREQGFVWPKNEPGLEYEDGNSASLPTGMYPPILPPASLVVIPIV